MKLKITEIIGNMQTYAPQGKNYSVYSWTINGQLKEDNGSVTQLSNEIIKTLSSWVRDQVKVNSVWNVNIETYNGKTSFKITDTKPKEESNKYQKKASIEKFDALVNHCWEITGKLMANETVDHDQQLLATKEHLFDRVLSCASACVDIDSLTNEINKKLDQSIQSLDNAVNNPLTGNPHYATDDPDEDLPF